MICKADAFAAGAHAGVRQKRKYTGEPYIVHPREVADIVSEVTSNPYIVAAALLHDVLEDTGVTKADLEAEFGGIIANLVDQVTDVSKPEDGNRAARKLKDRVHLSLASEEAQTIKLADLISNTRTIVAHDGDFAATYMLEKRQLLVVLGKGNVKLWQDANALVEAYFATQEMVGS
ncbi:MAG: HD domain-containing protein [Hyphomicrobium sp.]|nr:HD domain-containing protein [Hyphomicrobium sp.]